MIIRKFALENLDGTINDIDKITKVIWKELDKNEKNQLFERYKYARYFVIFRQDKALIGVDLCSIDALKKEEYEYVLPKVQRMLDNMFLGKIIYKNSSMYFINTLT